MPAGPAKYGRNKIKCAKYKVEGRREKNKKRRAEKRDKKLLKIKLKKESSEE